MTHPDLTIGVRFSGQYGGPVPDATTSRWRLGAVLVIVLLALTHVAAVTFAALPPNRYSEHTRSFTSYLSPYFTQNWRLFAPNPISDDRHIRFQGAYRAADGSVKTTDWVDWTDVELDLVHHRLVGGRAGYITSKLYTPLSTRYGDLGAAASVANRPTDPTGDVPSWADLRRDLESAGATAGAVSLYLRYDQAAVRLATDVLSARWPDRDWVAVRIAQRRQGVTPYDARHGSEAERERARPAPVERVDGWRAPVVGDDAERVSVASFDRRHR
jgi:hypothetical protein